MAAKSTGENGNLSRKKDLYIYEMPAKERYDLCTALDRDQGTWMVLAEQMKYSASDIQVRSEEAKRRVHFWEVSMIHRHFRGFISNLTIY